MLHKKNGFGIGFFGFLVFFLVFIALILGGIFSGVFWGKKETDRLGYFSFGDNQATETKKVYGMGDSMTAEYQVKLGELLGSSWQVISKGMGGHTTTQMLARFQTDILQSGNADYVIIWGGINDVGSGVGAVTIKANLQAMYTMAHNAGVKVVTINITPFKDNTIYQWSEERQAIVDDVNNWIVNYAQNIDFKVDMYSLLEDPAKPDTILSVYDYGDLLHLNTTGQYYVGQTVYNQVDWEGVVPASCYLDASDRLLELSESGTATSVITWGTEGASKAEVECTGPAPVPRGAWFLDMESSSYPNGFTAEFSGSAGGGTEECFMYLDGSQVASCSVQIEIRRYNPETPSIPSPIINRPNFN